MRRLVYGQVAAQPIIASQQELPPNPSAKELDPEQLRRETLLVQGIMEWTKRARIDSTEFFSFVMKSESSAPTFDRFNRTRVPIPINREQTTETRRRIKCAPHQRVLLSFVEAHPRCVLRLPAGASKTYCMVSEALRALGQNPEERGAIISATQPGAMRTLGMVRDYIENKDHAFPELHLVYPDLVPSPNPGDPWRQDALVVKRKAGIRDYSLVAVGTDAGSLPGSRLSWILIDDLINEENTRTAESRKKVIRWFFSTVLARDDLGNARIVVANTPWVDGGSTPDLTYVLERAGWPTLTMDVEGYIWVTNAAEHWDSDDLRPAERRPASGDGVIYNRLTAHDEFKYQSEGARPLVALPDGKKRHANDNDLATVDTPIAWYDIDDMVTLWPEKWPRSWVEETRRQYAGKIHVFNQLYMCLCTDEDEALCKVEWVEACKKASLKASPPHLRLVERYEGTNLTVTGVDLAIGQKQRHDRTAFFTYESMPDGKRRILDIECGRYTGPQIVSKIRDKHDRYRSLIRVETNAAQDFIRQWVTDQDASVPIRAHNTTRQNKSNTEFGIASVFYAFSNLAWIIPGDESGVVHRSVQEWLDACTYYQPPPQHTPDVLIACWLACEQEREITRGYRLGNSQTGSMSSGLLMR